jgi:hypothetical protein
MKHQQIIPPCDGGDVAEGALDVGHRGLFVGQDDDLLQATDALHHCRQLSGVAVRIRERAVVCVAADPDE